MQIPIFKNFLATSYFKAFVLNALVVSLITITAMTTQMSLDSPNGTLNKLFNKLVNNNNNTTIKFEIELLINFIITFCSVLCIMIFLYILVGFGGGMITPLNKKERKQIPFTELF
tara:strand:- start:962 stop:1306 length:345 start_codon:yes stop_codon:yes gene_type:complete